MWVAKFPWGELIVGLDGKRQKVSCTICSIVEQREKLHIPKLDG